MRSKTIALIVPAVILAGWIALPASAASPEELTKQFVAKIDELMPGMGANKIEDRKESQIAFERICFENSAPDKPAEREAVCRAIMQRVGADVPMPARVWLLRKVESIGRDEVVEPLTALMSESNGQIRELARRALANNPSPKAAAALRAELGKAKQPAWRLALINALGWRRDSQAAPQLAKLAGAKGEAVAKAAIVALARIGDDYCVESLAYLRKNARPELKDAVTDASFEVAEALLARGADQKAAAIYEEFNKPDVAERVRLTAIQGIAKAKGADAVADLMKVIGGSDERLQLAAARSLQNVAGEAVTKKMVAALAKASPDAQAVLIEAVGRRGDASALEALAKYLDAGDADVRTAAIGAMRYVGNGSVVEPLAKLAAKSTGPERDAARESLKWMRGQCVDDAIVSQLGKADARVNAELARAAAVRLMKPAFDSLLAYVNDTDESVRVPVIYNVGKLATPEDLTRVLDAFGKIDAGQNADAVKEAIVRICSKIGDENARTQPLIAMLSSAEPAVQVVIVQSLSSLRGQPALQAIRDCRTASNPQVKEAAQKALADWGPLYCTDWAFSGPYEAEGADLAKLFDAKFAPEEGKGEFNPVKGQKGRNIDLKKIADKQNCCGYLRTRIDSDTDQEVVLSFGSDDGVKVWLNDAVILEKNLTRAFSMDEDKVTARLKKGPNTLLVKVTQGGGDWAFACGIAAAQGGPPDTIKFSLK